MSDFLKRQDGFNRVSKMLTHSLILNTEGAWRDFAAVASVRLVAAERAAMSWASLTSLDAEHRDMVIEAIASGAGAPMPALLNEMDQAAFWSDFASPAELKAYALAAFNAMNGQDQHAFLSYVHGRAAA